MPYFINDYKGDLISESTNCLGLILPKGSAILLTMFEQEKSQKNTSKTYRLTAMALMAAVTSVMAQIAIPMPAGVPMTLQTFAVTLAGIVLGSKYGALSMLIYILMGAVGLPVFSSFSGGLGMLVGPTGGFLISFPIMAFIVGLGCSHIKKNPILFWGFITIGTIVNYVFGTFVFCLSTGATPASGIAACVIPFIPTTVVKLVLAGILGRRLRQFLSI